MSRLVTYPQALHCLQVQPLKQPRFSVSRSSTYRSSLFSVPTVRGQRSGGFIRGFEVGSSGVRSRRVSLTMAALPGLFPHADSIVVKTMEFLLAFSGPLQMYNEATGKNMGYAKFASALGKDNKAMVPSRVGMLSIYIVAAGLASVFLAYAVGFLPLSSLLESIGASGAASFLDQAVAASDDRLLLVAAALSVHFVKRSVEVSNQYPPIALPNYECLDTRNSAAVGANWTYKCLPHTISFCIFSGSVLAQVLRVHECRRCGHNQHKL